MISVSGVLEIKTSVRELSSNTFSRTDTAEMTTELVFDPSAYLKLRFTTVDRFHGRVEFPMQKLHEIYSSLPRSLKILEYGAGPSIANVISAASHASEVVMCEYYADNRQALHSWLRNDDGAFNWSHFFDYAVQRLEGKSAQEARKRQEVLRSVVTDVVHCNINEDPIIEEGYEGPYDVISTSCCLTCSCVTREAFKSNVAKIAALLKPGGRIIMFEEERSMKKQSGVYRVGTIEHPTVNVSAEFVADTLKAIGFRDVTISRSVHQEKVIPEFLDSHHMGFMFLTGIKN